LTATLLATLASRFLLLLAGLLLFAALLTALSALATLVLATLAALSALLATLARILICHWNLLLEGKIPTMGKRGTRPFRSSRLPKEISSGADCAGAQMAYIDIFQNFLRADLTP
jgi:hypothetical protein